MDLWENGRLECLARLTKWDDLAMNTLEEIEHETSNLFEPRSLMSPQALHIQL